MDYIFYDIESLPTHFCISYAINGGKPQTIRSATDFLKIAQGKQVVGFNNFAYDDYVIVYAQGKTPNEIHQFSDILINQYGKKDAGFPPFDRLEGTLDASQDLKDGIAKMSLKKAEQRLNLNVDSFELGFENLNRQLTVTEINRLEEYNRHDVGATRSVFKARYSSYFKSRFWIISELPEDEWNRYRGVGSLISKQLGDKAPSVTSTTLLYDKPDVFPEDFNISTDEWHLKTKDVDMVFGSGGVHSSIGAYKGPAIGLDVSSMYPTIIDNLGLLGSSYGDMKNRRIQAKHNGDTDTSNALKLSLNRTNGNFLSKFSKLYNPYAYNSVIKTGQIIIYRLHELLEQNGYTIIQDNTDGIMIKGDEFDDNLLHQFEEEYNLELERTDFSMFVQKDVNNYIAQKPNGKIKGKGSYFKGLDKFTLEHAPKSYYVANELTKRLLGIDEKTEYVVDDFVVGYAVTGKFHIKLGDKNMGRVVNLVASKKGYPLTKVRNEDETEIRLPDQPDKAAVLMESSLSDIDMDYYDNLVEAAYKKFNK